MPCNYSVYKQQRMRKVYFVERSNTSTELAGRREAERTKTGLKKRKEKCFQSVEVYLESILLAAQVIELQRTDVSITSSYLRQENNTINLGRGLHRVAGHNLHCRVKGLGKDTVNNRLIISFLCRKAV